jgi:hypothetical protein
MLPFNFSVPGSENSITGTFDDVFSRQTNNAVPRPRVLSSKSFISIGTPATDGIPAETLRLGEIDSFSVRKSMNVVKKWKPYGSKNDKILTEDTGWDINFLAGKVDFSVAYLFYLNEIVHRGFSQNTAPSQSEIAISLYNKPLFEITHTIIHYDGTEETYVYGDVTLLNYDLNSGPDNSEIFESVSAFSPYRDFYSTNDPSENAQEYKITNAVVKILEILNNKNRS